MLTKIYTGDADLQKLQDNVERAIQVIENEPGYRKVVLKGVKLTTSPQAVNHGLDREPEGYEVVRRNAPAVVYEPTNVANPQPKKKIILAASAAVTVDLWIF